HLVVIDVLAMGVAMARGPALVNHLKSVKRSLRSLRLSPKTIKPPEEGCGRLSPPVHRGATRASRRLRHAQAPGQPWMGETPCLATAHSPPPLVWTPRPAASWKTSAAWPSAGPSSTTTRSVV